ncbi:MAG: hypothetical protein M1343_10055 [Chloroflexi bacterium]|nr:hypothetical protein [Chloroflexota bacterium]
MRTQVSEAGIEVQVLSARRVKGDPEELERLQLLSTISKEIKANASKQLERAQKTGELTQAVLAAAQLALATRLSQTVQWLMTFNKIEDVDHIQAAEATNLICQANEGLLREEEQLNEVVELLKQSNREAGREPAVLASR